MSRNRNDQLRLKSLETETTKTEKSRTPPNISPNNQHLFVDAVKSTVAKFAPISEVPTNRSDSSCELNREITVMLSSNKLLY